MRILLVVLAAAALGVSGALASTVTARVRFVETSPVVVRGTGFVALERVTVTVSAKGSRMKVVTASSAGAFVVRFPRFAIGHCERYGVVAKGNQGSYATWKIAPMCAPASTGTTDDVLYPIDPP